MSSFRGNPRIWEIVETFRKFIFSFWSPKGESVPFTMVEVSFLPPKSSWWRLKSSTGTKGVYDCPLNWICYLSSGRSSTSRSEWDWSWTIYSFSFVECLRSHYEPSHESSDRPTETLMKINSQGFLTFHLLVVPQHCDSVSLYNKGGRALEPPVKGRDPGQTCTATHHRLPTRTVLHTPLRSNPELGR